MSEYSSHQAVHFLKRQRNKTCCYDMYEAALGDSAKIQSPSSFGQAAQEPHPFLAITLKPSISPIFKGPTVEDSCRRMAKIEYLLLGARSKDD